MPDRPEIPTDAPSGEPPDPLVRAYLRAVAEPLPPHRGALGLALLLGAVAGLVVLPPLLGRLPREAVLGVAALLLLALVAGTGLILLGGSGARRVARARAESALEVVATERGESWALREAAARLLAHVYLSQGPTTTEMIDLDEARARLGERVGLVEEVEEHLVRELGIYRAFTLDDGEA